MALLPKWKERWLSELELERKRGKEIAERIKYLRYWKKAHGADYSMVGDLKEEADKDIERYEGGLRRTQFLDSLIGYLTKAR